MSALTKRYLDEVARNLPKSRHEDIYDELLGLIADAVECRSHQTQDNQVAERQVLTEMGPPSELAASYSDRPFRLIGPALYAGYIHVLKILLGAVLPLFLAGNTVLELVDGTEVAGIVTSSALVAVNLGAQLFTLVTVAFAVLDRTGRTQTAPWTASQLPENTTATGPPQKKNAGAWLGISIAVQVALFILILWQHNAAPYTLANGEQVSILNPDLFSGWMWPILIGLASVIILDIIRASGKDWTIPFAVIYIAPQALFFLPLAWVFSQQLIFETRFLPDFNNGWQTPDEFYTAIAVILIAWFLWSAIDQFRTAHQTHQR